MVEGQLDEQIEHLEAPIYEPFSYARSLVTLGSRVLDVGCGNAKVGAYLAESGAVVDGIEPTSNRAAQAAGRIRYVSTMVPGETPDDPRLDGAYDLITLFDVLEHIVDPAATLAWCVQRLAPAGRIVASIPNSAHWTFRMKMLRGDWTMTDWGLFDRTHVRFFDPTTARALRPAGTVEVDGRYACPERGARRKAMKLWPRLFAQHVVLTWQRTAEDD